jgi:hypothetical protein
VRVRFPETRRKKSGERKMDTFISIDGKIRDGGNPLDLALPLSCGDLAV